MRKLSEFLAEHILDRRNFDEEEFTDMVKWFVPEIHEGIEKYKEHLQKDCPKTTHWAMIEKQIIEALTKAEQMPFTPKDEVELNKDRVAWPICPLNLFYEGDEDKCNTEACDFNTESRSCSEACEIEAE